MEWIKYNNWFKGEFKEEHEIRLPGGPDYLILHLSLWEVQMILIPRNPDCVQWRLNGHWLLSIDQFS